MASYQYGGFGGYNPYANPYMMNNPYQPQPQMAPRTEITRVNGKPGAEAFQMAPNSSILLLDETAPLVWLAQTDGAGYKTVTPYTVTPYQAEQPADVMKSFEERLARVEGILNGQSDDADARPARRSSKSAAADAGK